MTTMVTELYDALLAAGASEEKARAAAESVAAYDNRFAKVETDLAVIKSEAALHRWMLATNLAFSLAILAKLFLR